MPAIKRHKTKYAGVYFIEGKAIGSGKPERIYYIRYRKGGKEFDEKAGRHFQDDMTPARAAGVRADRIAGKQPTNKERRESRRAKKKAKAIVWTVDKLWREYSATRTRNKALTIDTYRYDKFIKPPFGKKQPHEIDALSVDRLRIRLLKKKSPQTVKHVLSLFTWIINFGAKKGLTKALPYHVRKPLVDNIRTEDLTQDQLKRLLEVIDEDTHPHAGPMMKLALFTGMRRGEIFRLKWSDVDFERGFIQIRAPKGGKSQKIPLNDAARELLAGHVRTDSPYVFPGRDGQQRVTIAVPVQKIKKEANLPKDFRPLHGLRHVYASMLASSGQVDMYQLQRLLTHKSPVMTQRYAHLRDEALRRASNVAGEIIEQTFQKKDNVVRIDQKR
jgi:integrase